MAPSYRIKGRRKSPPVRETPLTPRLCLAPARRQQLEAALTRQLERLTAQNDQQLADYRAERHSLERQRHKLLQAHYAEAIDLATLKDEQTRISQALAATERRITALSGEAADKQALVGQALDLAQHTATAYRWAPDHLRRLLNQTLFERIYLVPNQDSGQLTLQTHLLPPFDSILTWNPAAAQNQGEEAAGEAGEKSAAGGVVTSRLNRDHHVGSAAANEPGADIVVSPQSPHPLTKPPEDAAITPRNPQSQQKPTPGANHDVGLNAMYVVGVKGLEPSTSRSQTARASQLRHTPMCVTTVYRKRSIESSDCAEVQRHSSLVAVFGLVGVRACCCFLPAAGRLDVS